MSIDRQQYVYGSVSEVIKVSIDRQQYVYGFVSELIEWVLTDSNMYMGL